MKVVVTPRAETDIAHYYARGKLEFGEAVANRTFARVRQFVEIGLVKPTGSRRSLPLPNTYESWIPRTPFVVFYRIDAAADTVWVLALFHYAQNRSAGDLDDVE